MKNYSVVGGNLGPAIATSNVREPGNPIPAVDDFPTRIVRTRRLTRTRSPVDTRIPYQGSASTRSPGFR